MSSFDSYCIKPSKVSSIKSRSECIPYYGAFWSDEQGGWCLSGAYLPIFTAPMSCVVDDKNYLEFDKNSIIAIIPRTVPIEKRLKLLTELVWVAMGLDEFSNFVNSTEVLVNDTYICVDVANGHMLQLIDLCTRAKSKFGDSLILMAGNIANPTTYYTYAEAGIDFIRCSIGSGGACRTNDITGIGVPNLHDFIGELNLIKADVKANKNKYKSVPKIVMDGGMASIRDIIIALALGTDYVMCGKIFAQAEEAAGAIVPKIIPTEKTLNHLYPSDKGAILCSTDSLVDTFVNGRFYYGMSTERAQIEMGKSKIKHSEGSEQWIPIEYKLKDWVSQFDAAICSTMSYCNCKTLEDFIGNVTVY